MVSGSAKLIIGIASALAPLVAGPLLLRQRRNPASNGPSAKNTGSFVYRPLDEGEFRLLTLHCEDPEGPIRCTLRNRSFEHAFDYWALSYVWDQKPRTAPGTEILDWIIFINSKEFSVKWNLLSALHHIRKCQKSDLTLWIDAICINQNDVSEKNGQLAMMGDIYRQADRVHAWLGESAEDSDRIMRKAIPIGNAHLEMWSPLSGDGEPSTGWSYLNVQSPEDFLARRQNINDSDVLDAADITAFHKLILRPYWERLWILQEVALGAQVVFQCGYITIPWEYFGWLSDSVDRRPNHELDNVNFDATSEFDLVARLRKRIRPLQILRSQWQNPVSSRDLKLIGLVQKFRDWGCFKKVDHLFALNGLITTIEAKANQPDYTLELNEVFGTLVLSYAKTYGRLDGLNCHTGEHCSHLRSWIPDFSKKNHMHSLIETPAMVMEWLHGPKKLYAAAKDTIPEVSMDTSCNLKIVGIHFDTVSETGPEFPVPKVPILVTPEIEEWAKDCSRTVSRWHPGIYGDNFEDAVFRTYIADTVLTGRMGVSLEVPDGQTTAEEFAATIQTFMWKASRGRRLMFTRKGYIGLGPSDTRNGDIICIFVGGQTPYVLRHNWSLVSPTFQFIGECYVHGIMDGEALDLMDFSKRETFILI
jgi:hypothetical protein